VGPESRMERGIIASDACCDPPSVTDERTNLPMKGPGMRLDLDVRRVWRCPECGVERRTSGDRTIVSCHACKQTRWMTLVEPQRPVRTLAAPLDLVIDLHPDDVALPPSLPADAEPATEERADLPESAPTESKTETAVTEASASEKPRRGKRKNSRRRSRQKSGEDKPADTPATQMAAPPPEKQSENVSPPSPNELTADGFGEGLVGTQ